MAKKLNNQYELDIIQMFFEENLSVNEIYRRLKHRSFINKEKIRNVIKGYIKLKEKKENQTDANKMAKKIEIKEIKKVKFKKKFMELYRKAGFIESFKILESRVN